MDRFRNLLASLLDMEVADLAPDTRLAALKEWDSMSRVLFVAMIDTEYSRQVRGQDVAAAKTVQDLYALLG